MNAEHPPAALAPGPLGAWRWPPTVAWNSVGATLLLMAMGIGYYAWRLFTPSSCAWLAPDAASWTARGVLPRHTAECPIPDDVPVTDVVRGVGEVALRFADGSLVTLPLTSSLPLVAGRFFDGFWTLLFISVMFLLAAYAFARQPTDRALGAALVFATGMAISNPTTLLGLPIEELDNTARRFYFVANTQGLFSLLWGELLLFTLLFPTPMMPWLRRVWARAALAVAPLVVWLAVTIALLLTIRSATERMQYVIQVQSMISSVTILAIVVVILRRLVRMRSDTSDFVGRQQMLWLGGTSLSSLAVGATLWIIPHAVTGSPLLPDDLIGLPGLIAAFGFGIALLRFRLFAMERYLVRLLVDTVVVLLAIGTMFLAARTVAHWFGWDTVTLMVVGGIVVALGAPALRSRVERGVNWIVYRDPQSPYQVLSGVAESLAGRDVDFQQVAFDIRRALRLPLVRIVADGVEASAGVVDDVPGAQPVEFPIGQTEGVLAAYTRGGDDRLTDVELRLLGDLALQVGTALHQLRLTAELRRSREQLVLAREEERRVIRRVMHDDLAPTLAGISLQTETVRRLLLQEAPPPERAMQVLDGIARDARATSEGLRHLSYELRPPALDDRGLIAAIEDVGVSLLPLRLTVDAALMGDLTATPLPAAVEVAVYRITVEALRNAARHASATSCTVHMRREPGRCLVDVVDDGAGIPAGVHAGVGVTSMRERATELGGSLYIESLATGGTVVRVQLPIGRDDG
ncbi:MAG: histidine kinase [Arachnia sp.]